MLIRVMYSDGRFDMVKPQFLDNLLAEKKVTGFMRSGGWANVGRDQIRNSRQAKSYDGEERRAG